MGLLFSRCRRRERRDSEREPLLPKHRVAQAFGGAAPPQSQLNKIADVLAAVKVGKLPSEQQLERALRRLLDTEVFSHGHEQDRSLSHAGRKLKHDTREILESLLQFMQSKNNDNTLQEFISRYRTLLDNETLLHADVAVDTSHAGVDVDTLVSEIPSGTELTDDTTTFLRSLGTLCRTLLTSTVLRMLSVDFFAIAKDVIGDVAVQVEKAAVLVEDVAETVEATARDVEVSVRPETQPQAVNDQTIHDSARHQSLVLPISGKDDKDIPGRLKAEIVSRIQNTACRVQEDPASRRALNAMLTILRKYTSRLAAVGSVVSDAEPPTLTPIIWADPPLADALSRLKTLISRMASNRPLDTLINALYAFTYDLVNLPAEVLPDSWSNRQVKIFLDDLGAWFDSSLLDGNYAISIESTEELEELYDRAHALIEDASHSDVEWLRHLRQLMHEFNALMTAITEDDTTNRLVNALSTVSFSLSVLVRNAAISVPAKIDSAQRRVREDFKRDIFQWLFPRLLMAMHAIPMPRVEYRSTGMKLDATVDALYLTPSSTQASLVPDHIRVCNSSEVQLDVVETDNWGNRQPVVPSYMNNGFQVHTRLYVYVDGLRISARDVGYYVSWRPYSAPWLRWIGYEDEGVVSVDMGRRGVHGDGLSFQFELKTSTDREMEITDPAQLSSVFEVAGVHVTLRSLRLSLDKSKHWLLNKLLLQPLAGPIGSVVVGWVLKRQLRALLESIDRLAAETEQEVYEMADDAEKIIEWTDFASALWRVLTRNTEHAQEDSEVDANEETPLIETHTRITAIGVVRETAAYSATDGSSSTPNRTLVDESTLAVGMGAQILPSKGGPYSGFAEGTYGPRDLAREGLSEVQSRVDEITEARQEALRQGTEIRDSVNRADEREQARESIERADIGWHSHAFDL